MSSLRRQLTRTRQPKQGKIGGGCPKCGVVPLGMLEDAAPGIVPACKFCGYVSGKLTTYIVLTRKCDETTRQFTDEEIAERVIVRSDEDKGNAVRRCIRLGLINSRNRFIMVMPVDKQAFIPVAVLDRALTDEELDTVIDVNREMLEAGLSGRPN